MRWPINRATRRSRGQHCDPGAAYGASPNAPHHTSDLLNAPMSDSASPTPEPQSSAGNRLERTIGLTLALFAAVLAVVDLGAGKYGDDEIIGTNEKASLYQWYQSKSIKQSVIEQEVQLLSGLLDAGAVTPQAAGAVQHRLDGARAEIERYDREKREILLGSEAVGKEGQVLEFDGAKGQVIGTKPWEQKLAILGRAGDSFDIATLWLQIALVFGAISLIINSEQLKRTFYYALIVGALIGTGFGVQAFRIAMGEQPAQAQAQTPNPKPNPNQPARP